MITTSMTWQVTARDGGLRFHPMEEYTTTLSDGGIEVNIQTDAPQHALLGFGGAFTEASAVNFSMLGPENQQRFLDAYFHPQHGHGYRICRTHINSCDFSLGNYAYCDTPGDTDLLTFSLEREEKWTLPLIDRARKTAGEELTLFASPWSPPAWMKTNGEMNNGGTLKPGFRKAWADYYVRYIQEMESRGFPIWGLTVQNEPAATQPWDSCEYTAEEERDFVRDFLGPALEQAGLGDRKLIIWDHNRDIMFERAQVVLSDPAAARYVWGTGFHWYGEDAFENVAALRNAFPAHHLIFTEGCQEGGPHIDSWDLGERYARSIIHDLNNGTEAWVDWNLLLDTTGGPNHVGNLCSAPILADVENDELLFQSSYWYIGHFSRFLKPGARILPSSVNHPDLLAIAARKEDTVTAVLLNPTETSISFRLQAGDFPENLTLPPRSIGTFQTSLSQ